MTTIAYDGKTIAYDSRVTAGGRIDSDDFNKRFDYCGIKFFFSGTLKDWEKAFDAWESGECDEGGDFNAIVVDESGEVWSFSSLSDGSVEKLKADDFGVIATGSGMAHALTAMDMGADAKTAVKMAAKRDCCTGGRIRTYRVRK